MVTTNSVRLTPPSAVTARPGGPKPAPRCALPMLESGLALWQILVMVVMTEHTGQDMIRDLVADKGLEPQIRQACDERAAQIVHMTPCNIAEHIPLEHPGKRIIHASPEDRLISSQR